MASSGGSERLTTGDGISLQFYVTEWAASGRGHLGDLRGEREAIKLRKLLGVARWGDHLLCRGRQILSGVSGQRRHWLSWAVTSLTVALVGLIVGVPVVDGVLTADAFGPPVANLSAIPTSGDAPLRVTFDGSESTDPYGTIASWKLSFGDGSAAAGGSGAPPQRATHTYTTPGTYTATLSVTDTNSLTGQSLATVVVSTPPPVPPTAILGMDAGSGGVPLAETFDGASSTDTGGTITSWDLSYGDGTSDATGSGVPPGAISHMYMTVGTYAAKLSVTDSQGLVGQASAKVVAGAGSSSSLMSQLGVDTGSGPAPLGETFDGAGSTDIGGTITSWRLSFGDDTPDQSGNGTPPASIAHIYGNAGTFTATLSITDSKAVTASGRVAIMVAPAPPVAKMKVGPSSNLTGIHKIQHVIIIMQENRSFDNYFGTYPGADGIPMTERCADGMCTRSDWPRLCEAIPRHQRCQRRR